jgi:hypothetical protein
LPVSQVQPYSPRQELDPPPAWQPVPLLPETLPQVWQRGSRHVLPERQQERW